MGTGCDVLYVVTRRDTQLGFGMTLSQHYGQILHFSYLDHGGTVSGLRRGLISTLHSLYSFHLMSILPLCISPTLCIHTVGTHLAAPRPVN